MNYERTLSTSKIKDTDVILFLLFHMTGNLTLHFKESFMAKIQTKIYPVK